MPDAQPGQLAQARELGRRQLARRAAHELRVDLATPFGVGREQRAVGDAR